MARGKKREVSAYSNETGLLVKEYESCAAAARACSISEKTIRNAALRESLSQGYFWSYKKVKKHPRMVIIKAQVLNTLLQQPKRKVEKKIELTKNKVLLTQSKIDPILIKIKELYSPQELQALAKGYKIPPYTMKMPVINFNGEHFRFGVMGDTHLGSIYTSPELIYKAFEEFKKAGCEFMVHSGDVVEGMSGRPGHIYELTHVGYENQKKHSIEVFSQCPIDSYFIDGNHDRWFIKSSGALIVKDMCESIEGATFLGHDEGDIRLKKNAILRLWHGEDSSSYSVSYRMQKVVESLTGGEKPNIMILGHVHKQAYIFERNIQCISSGCMQYQSAWMRGKRLPAHVGFHIIDVWVNDKGVSKFKVEWFPIYSQPTKEITTITK